MFSLKLSPLFLLLFFAFGIALGSVEPVREVPRNMRWTFEFFAVAAAFAMLAAAVVLEKRLRKRE